MNGRYIIDLADPRLCSRCRQGNHELHHPGYIGEDLACVELECPCSWLPTSLTAGGAYRERIDRYHRALAHRGRYGSEWSPEEG